MKTKGNHSSKQEPAFEVALERLEKLVQEMEAGELPLETILKKYEEGNQLVKICAAKLNEAEQRIEFLMKEKDGSLTLKPAPDDDEDSELESSQESATTEHKEDKDLF